MHDNPAPSEEEHDDTPERIPEEDAKTGAGHEDPERQAPPADDDEDE